MSRILLFNKPYGVICQFSRDGLHPTLADYIALPGFYPAGRLDVESEGLLLLTDDGKLQHRITDPEHKLPKTYREQMEGLPDEAVLQQLRRMTAAMGHPTLRLIRWRIGDWSLSEIAPGQWQEAAN
ncbi:MAG: pseudouridine synthase [Gallionellaceae bacterium]